MLCYKNISKNYNMNIYFYSNSGMSLQSNMYHTVLILFFTLSSKNDRRINIQIIK